MLKTNAAPVRRFEIAGMGDLFTIHQHHRSGPVIEDLQQKPLLVTTEHTLCRCYTIEAPGGIGAVGSIEALNLYPTRSAIEEHPPISVHDCLDPDLKLKGAGEFSPSHRDAILTLPSEHLVFDAPIGVPLCVYKATQSSCGSGLGIGS